MMKLDNDKWDRYERALFNLVRFSRKQDPGTISHPNIRKILDKIVWLNNQLYR